ncbi:MAG TPA: hypothetical protein VIH28_06890 [Ignavibacteriaceae bacterium]
MKNSAKETQTQVLLHYFEVLTCDVANLNERKFPKNEVEKFIYNINQRKLNTSIFEDAGEVQEEVKFIGDVVGEIISAHLSKEDILILEVEINNDYITKNNITKEKLDEFSLLPLGAGTLLEDGTLTDFELMGFHLVTKKESSFYLDGLLITKEVEKKIIELNNKIKTFKISYLERLIGVQKQSTTNKTKLFLKLSGEDSYIITDIDENLIFNKENKSLNNREKLLFLPKSKKNDALKKTAALVPNLSFDLIKDKNFRDKLLKYFNGKNISIPKSILEKFDIEWSMAEIELFDMFELIVV